MVQEVRKMGGEDCNKLHPRLSLGKSSQRQSSSEANDVRGLQNDVDGAVEHVHQSSLLQRDLSVSWNLSRNVFENYPGEWKAQTLVWPPMLLVCIQGLVMRNEALKSVRQCLVREGIQAEYVVTLTKFVCWEGNTFYDLFVLPPTASSFAAAKAVDYNYHGSDPFVDCYYPSLKDMVDGGEKFDTLSAECSELCQDALRGIETSSSQTFAKNTCEERHYDGLSFEEKIKNDEEMMTREIVLSLTNSSTKSLLLTHLLSANGLGVAREVVERLKVLHKLSDSRTDSAPINLIWIKGAQAMELSTIRSIKERVQLEKQQEVVLGNLSRIGQRAILKLRKHQHQSLMELLRKTDATQTSKLEEFVDDKFKFVNEIQKTKKETESIVDWLSHHTARATDKQL